MGLTPIEITHNTTLIFAILAGISIFAVSVRDHLFVSILALAAPVMPFVFLLTDNMSKNDLCPEWAIKPFFYMAIFGSPVLFSFLTVSLCFSRLRNRKFLLTLLCVSGLTASIIQTILVFDAMRGMD